MARPVTKASELPNIYRRIDRLIEISNRRRHLAVIDRATRTEDQLLAAEAARLRAENIEAEWRQRNGLCPYREKVVDLNEYRNLSRFRISLQEDAKGGPSKPKRAA